MIDALDMGFTYLCGPVTYPNKALREIAMDTIPLDRICERFTIPCPAADKRQDKRAVPCP